MERGHHKLSMSKWPAWAICPHHESDGKTSDAASFGTSQHEQLEHALKTGDLSNCDAPVEWAATVISDMTVVTNCKLHVEDEVKIVDPFSKADGVTGYVDCWWMDGRTLHVLDYKSGAFNGFPYEVQLMGYAKAISSDILPKDIDERNVHLHILYGGSFQHIESVVSLSECDKAADDIMSRLSLKDGYAPVVNHACRWCSHLSECQAVKNAINNFEEEVNNMNNVQKLERFSVIEGIIKAEKKSIMDSMEVGSVTVDGNVGYKKVHCDGAASSVDIAKLIKTTCDEGVSITADDIISECTIGKTGYTKLVKQAFLDLGKKASFVGDIYSSCCEYGGGFDKLMKVVAK